MKLLLLVPLLKFSFLAVKINEVAYYMTNISLFYALLDSKFLLFKGTAVKI